MAISYKVGDIITYSNTGGQTVRVIVDEKEKDIKNGYPGFSGEEVNAKNEPTGRGVWGYDDQVRAVMQKAKG